MHGTVNRSNTAAPVNAEHDVARFVECVFQPDDIVEVRCLPGPSDNTTVNRGWHVASTLGDRGKWLGGLNNRGWNIYVGANPRPHKRATGDSCIQTARTIFVDFDGGCTADEARRRWEAAGLPEPTLVLNSGHGIHAYWRLVVPLSDLLVWSQLQKLLIAAVKSDASIHNPERIMRLPGFLNVKSEPHVPCFIIDADPERRYEFTELSSVLQHVRTETNGQTKRVPPLAVAEDESVMSRARAYILRVPNERQGRRNGAAFRVAAVLVNDFGLSEAGAGQLLGEWNAANRPPLDENELARVLASGGKYAKKPQGCKAATKSSVALVASVAQVDDDKFLEGDLWPDPLDEAAFHGLAAELVRLVEPHSEADPAALLVQTIVAFGNVIGRSAFFRAEADMHYGNLFTCLVGLTSKGRKGSSWGQISRLFAEVDTSWANNRVQSGLSSGEGLIWAVRDPIFKREPVREGGGKGKGKGRIVGYEDVMADPGVSD